MCKRFGFSVVELMMVIAMGGIMISLLLPSLQKMREAARNTSCLDNLRAIGMANLAYDEVNGSFPPYAGLPDSLNSPGVNLPISDYQLTYSQVQLLNFLGFEALASEVDPFAFSFEFHTLNDVGYSNIGEWIDSTDEKMPGISAIVTNQNLSVLRCPDDPLEFGNQAIFGTHPRQDAVVRTFILKRDNVSLTNYASNGGGIGITSTIVPALEPFRGFHGPIRSRVADGVATVPDGASNVALFGEALGAINTIDLDARHSLSGGWALGRATIYGGIEENFGDANESAFLQFGSFHPDVVNFIRCDGSTTVVDRDVDDVMLGRFCGAADGREFELFVLGDVNQDNDVDLLDVGPFVDLISNQEFQIEADIDRNGVVDLNDVQPFVDEVTD